MTVHTREDLGLLLKELVLLDYPAAEIGIGQGAFSLDILNWGVKHLYLVDAFRTIPNVTGDGSYDQKWHDTNREIAFEKLKPYSGSVTWLIGLSTEMHNEVADKSLGFLYLDACHSKECVLADLNAWVPKLIPGGILAMHDYLNPAYGVSQAAKEFFTQEITLIPDIDEAHAGAWVRV